MNKLTLWSKTVTDRSQSDISYAKELLLKDYDELTDVELLEYIQGLKGCINEKDLARIQNNIKVLSDVLELGLVIEETPNLPKESFYQTILDNMTLILANTSTRSSTPSLPQMPLNTIDKWNTLEKILEDVYDVLLNNLYYYGGSEIYAGEEVGYLL